MLPVCRRLFVEVVADAQLRRMANRLELMAANVCQMLKQLVQTAALRRLDNAVATARRFAALKPKSMRLLTAL